MTTQELSRASEASERANGRGESSDRAYRPNVDIFESPEALMIFADMPGASAETIDVKFEDETLLLLGRVKPRQSADTAYLLQEYGVGDFYREFQVTEKINVAGVTAEYVDGTLRVHLPKVEAAKPRKIDVQAR